MVSTRSQSMVTNSNVLGGDADQGHAEVTSKQTRSTRKAAPATKSASQPSSKPLKTIEEDNPRSTRRKQPAAPPSADELLSQVAQGILDALDDSSDGEEELPKVARWKPDVPHLTKVHHRPSGTNTQTVGGVIPQVIPKSDNPSYVAPPDKRARDREAKKTAPDTAGKAWFNLPAQQITDEVKNDLRLIRLRGALDPKTFYKKFDDTKFPKYFQTGTVVEGATDFYSSRLTKKERKQTFTEEIMTDPHLKQVRKRRYTRMQEEKMQWGNKKGRKTDNPRNKKKPQRPKH